MTLTFYAATAFITALLIFTAWYRKLPALLLAIPLAAALVAVDYYLPRGADRYYLVAVFGIMLVGTTWSTFWHKRPSVQNMVAWAVIVVVTVVFLARLFPRMIY